jgi:hypothetical protein
MPDWKASYKNSSLSETDDLSIPVSPVPLLTSPSDFLTHEK